MYFPVTVVDVIALLLMILSRNPLTPCLFHETSLASGGWEKGGMLSDILHLASIRCQNISRHVFRDSRYSTKSV